MRWSSLGPEQSLDFHYGREQLELLTGGTEAAWLYPSRAASIAGPCSKDRPPQALKVNIDSRGQHRPDKALMNIAKDFLKCRDSLVASSDSLENVSDKISWFPKSVAPLCVCSCSRFCGDNFGERFALLLERGYLLASADQQVAIEGKL